MSENLTASAPAPVPSVGHTKIAVVGAGFVGSSFAYALLLSGLSAEIVLIDANRAKAEGEAMDLQHSVPFGPSTKVRVGEIADCAGALVTVITAGANQKPGESRLDLGRKNAGIFKEIIPAIAQANPGGLLLIATNPVDVLTYLSVELSGLPPKRVLGSGTILDTARFRHYIGDHFGVDPQSVSAHIIGEHGDGQVPAWSLVSIGGMRLYEYCVAHGVELTEHDKSEIARKTRDAAQHIIARKGATYYAIGAGLVQVVAAIVRDTNTILPVGSLLNGYDGLQNVTFGLPTVVNRNGAAKVLELNLSETEREALHLSAAVLKTAIAHAQTN